MEGEVMEGEGVMESEGEKGVGSGTGGELWGVMGGGEQWREWGRMEGGGMMEGEGGGMMEGEGGGMMEGEGGGMVWWREGGGALELTHLGLLLHSSIIVHGGSLCPRVPVVRVGSCHLGVGHCPCALEGCAGGGARRLSWFHCDGLGMVVGVCVGGGSLLPMGTCRSWVRGWGILVVGRVLLSVGGHCPCALVGGVGGGACCLWWWLSVGFQCGGGRCSLA